MIGSLRGTVLERTLDHRVLVEVNMVGYLVTVTPRTLGELEPTTQTFLYTHHHIREDAHTLFGFLTRDERAAFQMLISTHGIGPSLAMSILATHTPGALAEIIATQDSSALTLVPGVGKKTAERLLVELKSKVAQLDDIDALDGASRTTTTAGDVRQALVNLGYTDTEVRDVMSQLSRSESSSDLLREALRILGARHA